MTDRPRLMTLDEWAAVTYTEASRPTVQTLRAWARAGKYDPPARQVGRQWWLQENAVALNHTDLIAKIRAGGKQCGDSRDGQRNYRRGSMSAVGET